MSLSDRRTILLSFAALAGCGFTPVYGPGGAAATLRGRIRMDSPKDQAGFQLVRRLEERLGPAEAPVYALSASIALREDGIGITRDQVTTRYQLAGTVDFRLSDVATGKRVTSGTVSNFTSYSASGTTVATRVAEEDARARLMVILADEIVSRLLATAPDWSE